MSIVINLFGAPGAGKSTMAASVFSVLKQSGVNAELVTEFAKDKVWEQNDSALAAQDYIFACQHYKLRQLAGKVDVIVTDSPLLLSLFYTSDDPSLGAPFHELVRRAFSCYDNMNFFLFRTKEYQPAGRLQTEAQSNEIAFRMIEFLNRLKIPYQTLPGSLVGQSILLDAVVARLKARGKKEGNVNA